MEQHEKEHDERIAFTYTVLDPTGSICLGCVYIHHLKEGPMGGDHSAVFRFWILQSHLDKNLDRRLLTFLIDWFRNDWAFSRVVLIIADADEKQNQLVNDLRLQLVRTYGSKWSEYLIKSAE